MVKNIELLCALHKLDLFRLWFFNLLEHSFNFILIFFEFILWLREYKSISLFSGLNEAIYTFHFEQF